MMSLQQRNKPIIPCVSILLPYNSPMTSLPLPNRWPWLCWALPIRMLALPPMALCEAVAHLWPVAAGCHDTEFGIAPAVFSRTPPRIQPPEDRAITTGSGMVALPGARDECLDGTALRDSGTGRSADLRQEPGRCVQDGLM